MLIRSALLVLMVTTFLIVLIEKYFPPTDFLGYLELTFYIVQGLILFYGAVALRKALIEEFRSDTHQVYRRPSKTKFIQVVRLILGGPSREWFFASALAPITVGLGYIQNVSLTEVIVLQLSLFLSALVLYALFMIFVIHWDVPKVQSNKCGGITGSLTFISVMAIVMTGIFILTAMSPSYSSPAYYTFTPYPLFLMLQRVPLTFSGSSILTPSTIVLRSGIMMQLSFQLPVLGLCIWGAARKLRYPDFSLLSNSQAFIAATIAFLIFVAEIALCKKQQTRFLLELLPLYVTIIGLLGVYAVTPGRMMILEYKRFFNKEDLNSGGCYDFSNVGSNMYWLVGYAILTIVFAMVIAVIMHARLFQVNERAPMLLSLVMLLCILALVHVAWFAGMYEAFRLGPYHRNTKTFALLIALLWFIAPLLGLLMNNGFFVMVGVISSPFVPPFGAIIGYTDLQRHSQSYFNVLFYRFMMSWAAVILLNAVIAIVFQILAARCRRAISADE